MNKLKELLSIVSQSEKETQTLQYVKNELTNYDKTFTEDIKRNIYVTVGDKPKTLFTAHTDCVHRNDKPILFTHREVFMFPEKVDRDIIYLNPECENTALGADDKCGVRLLLHMIEHNIPGMYVFTVEEEIGCKGASIAADNLRLNEDALKTLTHGVCFDRKDIGSVITRMCGGTVCSDAFADGVITQLGMGHHKDTGGSSTDIRKFDFLSNVTNISVGYYNEHSIREYVDVSYYKKLMERVLVADWDSLSKHEAKPQKVVTPVKQYGLGYNWPKPNYPKKSTKESSVNKSYSPSKTPLTDEYIRMCDEETARGISTGGDVSTSIRSLKMYVDMRKSKSYFSPEDVTGLLTQLAVDVGDIEDTIEVMEAQEEAKWSNPYAM